MTKSLRALVEAETESWAKDPSRYLGLKYGKNSYDQRCPPLLVMGEPSSTHTLVVVSLEPLRAEHYKHVCAAATQYGAERFNFDYFGTFPEYSGTRTDPQQYWRRMACFATGWSGGTVLPDPSQSWQMLRSTMIEIPMWPMHAKKHRGFSAWNESVKDLFVRRVSIVMEAAPDAVLVALGRSAEAMLKQAGFIHGSPREHTPASDVAVEQLGTKFFSPVRMYQTARLATPRLFTRVAFTSGHQPRGRGLVELGRWLRRIAISQCSS